MFSLISKPKQEKEGLTKEQEELFYDYLSDARNIIRSFQLDHMTPSELQSLAEYVLLWCVTHYKKGKGAKFTTYLFQAIKNAVKGEATKYQPYKTKEEKEKGITVERLPGRIPPWLMRSLEQPIAGISGEEIALKDVLEDVDAIRVEDSTEYVMIMEELKKILTSREWKVLNKLMKGETASSIGKDLNLTPGRMSWLIRDMLEKARVVADGVEEI